MKTKEPKTDEWLEEYIVRECGGIVQDPNSPGNYTFAVNLRLAW